MSVKRICLFCVSVLIGSCGTEVSRPLSMNALDDNPDMSGFAIANKVIPIEFPRDHGEHLDFQTEWWYLVGVVEDEHQREFGFQFTLFRQAMTPKTSFDNAWRTGQIYMAHFAITGTLAPCRRLHLTIQCIHRRLGIRVSGRHGLFSRIANTS